MTGDRITLSKDDAGSEAAHAFAKQRGGALPFQQLDPTSLAAFALRIGRSVLSDVLAGRSESTSTQSNQGSLALVAGERIDVTLIDRALINGVAGRQDNTYVAALYTGLPVVIAEIASAIWANPRFMPWLGLELEDSARPIHLASQQVPPGMGMLAHLCSELDADELSALAAHMRSVSLEAIAGHAGAISPLRTSALVRTIADALAFIWLHEIGHILLGHVDSVRRNLALADLAETDLELDPQPEHTTTDPNLVRQMLEVMADGFAARLLFLTRNDAAGRPHEGQLSHRDGLAIANLAAVIVSLALHATSTFRASARTIASHPPLWFRAQRLLALEAHTYRDACRLAGRELLPPSERAMVVDACSAALSSLAAQHVFFGEWIGPMQDEERRRLHEHYLRDLKHQTATSSVIVGLVPKLAVSGVGGRR